MNRNISISIVLLLAAVAAQAQAVSFINLPDNAARMALGGSDVSYDVSRLQERGYYGSAEATYFIWEPSMHAGGSVGRYMADGYARLGESFGISARGRVNSVRSLSYMDDSGKPGVGFNSTEFMAGVGVHYRPFNNISVLARVDLISSNLAANFAAKVVAADLGVAYDFNDLSVALTVRNLGSKLRYSGSAEEALPTAVLLGGEYLFGAGRHVVDISADAGFMPLQKCALAKVGVRLSLFSVVDIMAGYHYGSNSQLEPSYATAGLGAQISFLRLSAAYVIAGKSSPMKNTMAFTLGARF